MGLSVMCDSGKTEKPKGDGCPVAVVMEWRESIAGVLLLVVPVFVKGSGLFRCGPPGAGWWD